MRELVNVVDIGRLRRVFRIVAAGSGQLLKKSGIARDAELAKATASTWLGLLEATHLVDTVPGWGGSHRQRVVKMPKAYVGDTGVLAAMLRVTPADAVSSPQLTGPLAETFVVQEVLRQVSFQPDQGLSISHCRDRDQREIDLLVEAEDGAVAAIEIKAAASVSPSDARHIDAFAERLGKRFRRGVVVYCGEHPLRLSEHVTAVPMANLWSS